MAGGVRTVCVIGAGPRGLSVLDRLCAAARVGTRPGGLVVHVVDPAPPRADGSRRAERALHLSMDAPASGICACSDGDGVLVDDQAAARRSLYAWAREVAEFGGIVESGGLDRLHGLDARLVSEASTLRPDSRPSRALYERYIAGCFQRIAARAPRNVFLHMHRSGAVAMADIHGLADGRQGVRLENGIRLNDLDAVVLAEERAGVRPTALQERTAALARIHYLTYVTPGDPLDADLDSIEPGRNVLIRGLGPAFSDYLALLTLGRAGRFLRNGDRIHYRPSGEEPVIHAAYRGWSAPKQTPESVALVEAGVLKLTGPATEIRFDATDPAFAAVSRLAPLAPVRARALIEARPPRPDPRRALDPLLIHLLKTDQATAYPSALVAAPGARCGTGGLAVACDTPHLLDARGHAHPRRFALGQSDQAAARDADTVARAVVALPPAVDPHADGSGPAAGADMRELIV